MNWKRNLNRLWLAQSTSLLGLQVGAISIPLVAVEALHATATEVGLLAAISQLPWLILPPIIGGLADRVDRRRLLIAAHLGRAVLWTTLPIAYLLGVLTLVQLFIVVLLVGLLGMIFEIAYRAFLPQVVPTEGLGSANGRMAATDAVARTSGPALAGFLIQRFSAPVTIMVQAATCLVAGIATLAVPWNGRQSRPDRSRQTLGSWFRDIGSGFGCLVRIPALRLITATETLYLLFFSMCFAVIIVFLRTTAEISAGLIGVVFSVGSLGGLLGAAVANRLWRRFGFDRMLAIAAILRGAGLLLMPVSLLVEADARVVVLIAARAVNACSWTIYEVLADTYQQTVLPDRFRGSATAAGLWLGRCAELVGAAAAAGLVIMIGMTPVLVVAGLGATLAGLVTLKIRTSHSPG